MKRRAPLNTGSAVWATEWESSTQSDDTLLWFTNELAGKTGQSGAKCSTGISLLSYNNATQRPRLEQGHRLLSAARTGKK